MSFFKKHYKFILSYILIFLFIIIFSCCSYGKNINIEQYKSETEQEKILFENVKQSIIKITVVFNATLIKNKKEKYLQSQTKNASGSIIKNVDNKSFILTAGHVCDFVDEDQIKSVFKNYDEKTDEFNSNNEYYIFDIKGNRFKAILLTLDRKNDMCILLAKDINRPSLSLSEMIPSPGEKIYSMNFPKGIFYINYIPIFSGYFSGIIEEEEKNRNVSSYSIASTYGSSGGAIFNNEEKVVGMIHSCYTNFPYMSLSSNLKDIKDLVDISYDIYHILEKQLSDKLNEN